MLIPDFRRFAATRLVHQLARLTMFAILFALATAQPGSAGDLTLQINDGRVTLKAHDVTVRQILAEWARIGSTRIVNGERVGGGLVSLELIDVPERQALDVLLRSVSGYMAAPRAVPVATASIFDRILVMPTSAGSAAAGATAGLPRAAPRPVASPGGFFGPAGPSPAIIQPDQSDTGADDDAEEQAPNVAMPGGRGRPFFRQPDGQRFIPAPAASPQNPIVTPIQTEPDDAPDATAPSAANPWGVPAGTSAVPGVVIQPPQPVVQPGQPQRPRP